MQDGFYDCHKTDEKILKSLYGFGGRCLKIRDFCMDFEPYFKVYNLVSVHPKSIMLGQMTNLDMIFNVVSVYWLVKIWNSPQVPLWISERPMLVVQCITCFHVNATALL